MVPLASVDPARDGDVSADEPFDVEPPYLPDEAALAAVAAYDDRFLDRELSWLRFNQRVLELAEDTTQPLLERVRFSAIFANNLDEFFMVRVAGLKRRIAADVAVRAASGLMPRDVLERIWAVTRNLMERHARLFREDLVPELSKEGIDLVRWDELDREEQKLCKRLFKERVFPVLTPLAVDPAHPFPYISGLSLNLAVLVRNPKTQKEHFARVKVPPIFSRFVPLGNQRFVPLEDVIAEHLKRLFPGMDVLEVHSFRVTRNEDLEVEEDDAENLLKALEKELLRRRFGPPVRLEVEDSIAPQVLELLISELGITTDEVFRVTGPLDLVGLHSIADLPREDLKFPAFVPTTHSQLAEVESSAPVDVFKATARYDVLLHHPYDSFATSVQRFLEQAAADPHVLAIKQTLYRTSGDSPIIDALVDAAESGKQVLVIVEIKARFDEEANIRWARKLEQAGCHVVYGLVGLKTHCKLSMVVRDEPEGIRRYTHIGTGNYNGKTARMYEDLGLITTNEVIGEDVAHLFNNLSGYSRNPTYERLLVAPDSVRTGLIDRIHREVDHHVRTVARRGSGSRPTPWSTRGSSTRSTSRRRPACRWRCWCAASARCGPACPGCRRTSWCARSWAASSSTAGSTGSRTAAIRASGSGRPTSCTATSTAASRCWCSCPVRPTSPRSRRCSTWRSRPRRTPGSWAATASGSPTTGPTTCRRC